MRLLHAAWRRAFRSLTARLALMLAGVFALVLSAIGGFLYDFLDAQIRERDRAELEGKGALVRHFVGQIESLEALAGAQNRLGDALIGHQRLHVVILDPAGTILFSSPGTVSEAELVARGRAKIAAHESATYSVEGGTPFRASTQQISLKDAANTELWAIVALETTDNAMLLRTYLRSLVVTLVLGAVLAALAGFWAIRQGLAPIARIARTAEQVSAKHLESRIPLEDTPTELMRLVQGFNAMLERLDESFRQLSQFSSDLAHELRTPIHSLLGHAQVALSRERPAAEYRLALEMIVEEAERLARTVRDMLFLAQADNASLTLRPERVDLRSELDTVISFFHVLAEERNVTIVSDGAASVAADRNMVQRAISNLLSNALRHTPDRGTIAARIVAPVAGEAWIEVVNSGPGIPPESIGLIFDRFYRADRSRSDETGGTGLGLAIVKSIMGLHNGQVEANCMPGGPTTFRLRFPA